MPLSNQTSSCQITLDGRRVEDAGPIFDQFKARGIPISDAMSRCNSFTNPRGPEFGRGYLLMLRRNAKPLIDASLAPMSLVFEDGLSTVSKLVFPIRAHAVTGVREYDPDDQLFVMEVADQRYMGRMSTVDARYNVRSFRVLDESDAPVYCQDSTRGGALWSWKEMVNDLFTRLPTQLASFLDMGEYPTDPPENYTFRGITAWDAITKVLEDTGNVWADGVIRHKGTSQGGINQYLDQYICDPANDLLNYNMVPAKVRVYFPKLRFSFQQSFDDEVLTGKDHYLSSPLYYHDVNANTVFDGAAFFGGTIYPIHDSLAAKYDELGNIVNESECIARAEDRAAAFLTSLKYPAGKSLHTVYNFFHNDKTPGSEITAVSWYSCGSGSKTEVIYSPIRFDPKDKPGCLGHTHLETERRAWEAAAPPDLARVHEQTERWASIELVDDLDCKDGSVEAKVLFGMNSSGVIIDWDDSGKRIRVHNPTTTFYPKESRIYAKFHWQTRRWIVDGPGPFPIYRGNLANDMCPGATASLQDSMLFNIQCCSNNIRVSTANNPFFLAGKAGDDVYVIYDCTEEDYVVFQVKHKNQYVVEGLSSSDGCEPVYDEYGYDTGETTNTGSCSIGYTRRHHSVMYCEDPQNLTVVSFQPGVAMIDWYVSGSTIVKAYQQVFFPCACSLYTKTIPLTVCGYGSGS